MNGFETQLRRTLLKTIHPVMVWAGKQHAPFAHKLISGLHCYDLIPQLKKGMVFTTRISGEMSNLLIPGFYTHAAMYVGGPWVIEAVGAGVVKTDIVTFMMKKDYILVRAPNFVDESKMAEAADWALTQLGKPYDYEFQSSLKAFYCSELVGASYSEVYDGKMPFEMRTTLGEPTITPDDIANAHKLWYTVWDSRYAQLDQSEVKLIA